MNMTASEDGSPYVGRRAFTLDDHNVFFGRDREIKDLLTLWRSSPLVVLHGLAGSGKTSLLQAGVAPRLAEEGEIIPLGSPLGASFFPEPLLDDYNPYSLAVLASWSPGESRTRLVQQSGTDFLRRRAQHVQRQRADSLLMVAIDQVEGILVDERAAQARDEFFADLAVAMGEVPGLRLLLATRTDTLSALSPYERQLFQGGAKYFSLESMSVAAAVEAVRCPMDVTGYRFDAGTAECIVDELRGSRPDTVAVQPSQLQIVCGELWDVIHPEGPLITRGFVRDNIDVDRALANFCASAIAEVGDRYKIPADRIFNWLMPFFVSSDPVPVTVPEAELTATGIPAGVLRALENEHLITAEWRLDVRRYALANDRLVAAMSYLAKSPAFGQPKLDPVARMRVAESALAAGELDLARQHAEEALHLLSQAEFRLRADVLSLLGNIEYQADRMDSAEKYYQDAAELSEQLGDQPGVGRLFGAIGSIHFRQGKYLGALGELQAAVTRSPSDLSLQTKLATALWRSDQSQAAAAVFGAVLSVEPESADALAGRGQISAERGNAEAALDDLQTLRRIRPRVSQQPEVQLAHALALAAKGMPETAMEELAVALTSTSDNAIIFVRAARVALASGAMDRAKELLRQAEQASHPALSSSQRTQVRRLMAEASQSRSAQ